MNRTVTIPSSFTSYSLHAAAEGFTPNENKCAQRFRRDPGVRQLWTLISAQYGDEVTKQLGEDLPQICSQILEVYGSVPKMTPTKWATQRQLMARHAEQLAIELTGFFDRWETREEGGEINFTQLLTQEEQERIPSELSLLLLGCGKQKPGIVPDLPEMMRRIASLFRDDASAPIAQRPSSKNAERNYFARRLLSYFRYELGSFSPTIIARIVSIFFPDGITENDISKMANRMPDGSRRHPDDRPETSTLNKN